MMKKAASVLGACFVVLFCILSPKLVSKKQEENLIGRMYERKIVDLEDEKEAEELLERIEIYAEGKKEEPFLSEDIRLNPSEEYAQEKLDVQMEEIADSVRQQIEKLKEFGIISEGIEESFCEQITSYHVQTYLNEKTQSVTVWKIEVQYEERIYELCMEEQSGELIEFSVPKLKENEWEVLEKIADRWGQWVGLGYGEMKVQSESEEVLVCDYITDNSRVTYEVGSTETDRYIRLK